MKPLALALLAVLLALPAAAQQAPPVQAGDRIRIVPADGARPFAATVVQVLPDSLVLVARGDTARAAWSTLGHVYVSRGSRRGRTMLRYAGIGFAAGAVVGAVGGFADGDDPRDCWLVCFSAEEKALLLGASLGVVGGTVGLVAGAVAPAEQWVPASRPVAAESRGFEVGLSLSF